MDKTEKIARAYRNAIYGVPGDEKAWEASKSHWIRDTNKFLEMLASAGLEVVEIKKKPVETRV